MPRVFKNTHSYNPQDVRTEYKIAARQTTMEDFANNTIFSGNRGLRGKSGTQNTSVINRSFQYKDI